jgi:hypothetical protein
MAISSPGTSCKAVEVNGTGERWVLKIGPTLLHTTNFSGPKKNGDRTSNLNGPVPVFLGPLGNELLLTDV